MLYESTYPGSLWYGSSETERNRVILPGPGSYCLMLMKFHLGKVKKFWRRKVLMVAQYLTPLNCTPKNYFKRTQGSSLMV